MGVYHLKSAHMVPEMPWEIYQDRTHKFAYVLLIRVFTDCAEDHVLQNLPRRSCIYPVVNAAKLTDIRYVHPKSRISDIPTQNSVINGIKMNGINSYSASHDNWCTATLWNRMMTAQCKGMGEVGSARYEPALLPPCQSIRVLSYSNCQEIHSRQQKGLAV